MFDGRAAKYASFRAKFLSWAVVQIAGVDELDALRNAKNPATWYPRYKHVVDQDTGELTVSADDDERWTARVMGDTPGYEFADTPQEKRNARKLDKNARTKLAAAIRTACTKSSTARSITENADLNDGISTLMFLNKRFAQPVSNPNIALEMKQTLWNIQYGTRTIEAFLEEIEDTIASVTMHGVEVTEGDKYAAIIRGVQASDPDFADMLKSTMGNTTPANQTRPYAFMLNHLQTQFPQRVASEDALALAAERAALAACQLEPSQSGARSAGGQDTRLPNVSRTVVPPDAQRSVAKI